MVGRSGCQRRGEQESQARRFVAREAVLQVVIGLRLEESHIFLLKGADDVSQCVACAIGADAGAVRCVVLTGHGG